MNIAIIPARGGSKRIPRKNIKLFHGKPIIAYSIEAAIKAACFDEIIVSTDDLEIANVAQNYGASAPFMRPAELSDDHATTLDVIKHAILWALNNNINVQNVCCIYPTAPLLDLNDIKAGLDAIESGDYEFSFSATDFGYPIQRAFILGSAKEVKLIEPSNELVRSQDLATAYHDAGQFYWGRAQAFIDGKSIFSNKSYPILLPRLRVQDIDTQQDWDIAEKMYMLALP